MARSEARHTRRWHAGILLFGIGISALGNQIFLVTLNLWVLDRTHSALAVAGLWMISPLSGLLLGTITGSLADHRDRRNSLVTANVINAFLIGVIPILSHIRWIYGILFVTEGLQGLFTAAMASYYRLLVSQDRLAQFNAIRGSLAYGAITLGPAVAGLLLAMSRPRTAIWIDSATFLASALTLLLLPSRNPVFGITKSNSQGQWRSDLVYVGTFLRRRPMILSILAGFYGLVVFGSTAASQEVVFIRNVLHLSQENYGLLMSLSGVGYVIGSGLFYVFHKRWSVRLVLGTSVSLSAASYLWFARSHDLLGATLSLMFLGVFQSIANVGFSTFLQQVIPIEAIGRISGTTMAVTNGATVLAIFGGGLFTRMAGIRLMMTTAAVSALLSGLWLSAMCLGPGHQKRWRVIQSMDQAMN